MRKRGFLNLCLVAALSVTTASSLYSCKDYDDDIAELQDQLLNQNSTLTDLINAQGKELNQLKSELESMKEGLIVDRTDLEKMLEDYLTKDEAKQTYVTFDRLTAELTVVNAKIKSIDENIARIETVVNTNSDNIADLYKKVGDMKVVYDKAIKELEALGVELKKSVENIENTVNNVLGSKIVAMSDSLAGVYGVANANSKKIAELEKLLGDLTSTDLNAKLVERVNTLEKDLKELQKTAVSQKELDALYAKLTEERESALCAFKQSVRGDIDRAIRELTASFTAADNAVKVELLGELGKVADRAKKNEDAIVALNKDLETVKTQLDKLITSINLNGAYSPVIGYFNAPIGVKSNILAAYYGSTDEHGLNFPTRSSVAAAKAGNEFTKQEWELLGLAQEDPRNPQWAQGDCLLDETEGNAGTLYMTVNPNNVDLSGTEFKLVNSEGKQSGIAFGKPVPSNHRLSFGYSRAGSNNGFYEVKAQVSKENIADSRVRIDLNKIKEVVQDVLSTDDGVDMTKLVSTLYTEFNDIADANAVEATWKNNGKDYSVYSDYGLAAIAVKPLSYKFMQDYQIDQFWGMDKAYALVDKIAEKVKTSLPEFPQLGFENMPKIDTIKLAELTDDMLGKFVLSLDTTIKVEVDTVLKITVPKKDVQLDDFGAVVPGQTIKDVPVELPVQSFKQMINGEEVTIVVPAREITIDVTVPSQNVTVDGPLVTIDEFEIKQPFTFSKGIQFHYVVDMRDAVKELWGNVEKPIEDVNKMIVEIKNFIDNDLQKMLDDINGYTSNIENSLNDAADKIKGELTGYLDKINEKLCSLVEGVNAKLQPVMFVKTTESFAMLSQAKNYPSYAPSSFVLSPSSYTAELLAPAFKKFVAVTDVIDMAGNSAKGGDSKCVSVLKSSNKGDLNKVIEGKQLGIKVDGLKSGYVYEFTYSALDYYGYVANSKYYVYVK